MKKWKMLSSRDIVKEINKRLQETWTDLEWKSRRVELRSEWKGRMNFVVSEYRNAGWSVKKEVLVSSCDTTCVYLIFKNPASFKSCPAEIRKTGVC